MERLLITGVDRAIGANLALALADRFEVLGLFGRAAVSAQGINTAACGLHDTAARHDLVADFRPRWVLCTGPYSAASWDCPRVAPDSDEFDAVSHWVDLAHQIGARSCVISSDVVFAGPRLFHDESEQPAPPSPWAEAVRRMERTLERTSALVVRTHAYGWSPNAEPACLAERAWRSLSEGESVAASGRRHATPILATELAELLKRMYELRLQGLYHLSGAERASAFQFVQELARAFDLPSNYPGSIPQSPTWPDETSLSSKRARRELELPTPMLREGLVRFAEQARDGWHDRWQVGGQLSASAA